ncbi:MAG: tRNA pseudouridine(38-40) synthase TruA [Bacteroidales bacterium]|nr:tRNA pseudouridine(38-40) synthase TruA [Bacteroidales bacterium]
MMRYIIRLSYDGSAYCGWQIQPSAVTVQGEVERCLSTLLGTSISVTGAGRTDTGVNAVNYVLHFDVEEKLPMEPEQLAYKLNAILPLKIVVHELVPAPVIPRPEDGSFSQDWHARYSAVSREYHYFIHQGKDPFVSGWSWWCRYPLDMDRMNEACRYLLGEHDFSCFEKTGGNNKTSICTIFDARWEHYVPTHVGVLGYPDQGYLVFTVRANRFLRNMVRAIVGSMVEVGRGRKDPEWFAELVDKGTRCDAGESVPGHALFLNKVEY